MLQFLLQPSNVICKTQEEKESLLHLPIFLWTVFFLPSWRCQAPSVILSIPCRELLFALLSRQVSWLQILLVCLHLRMSGFPSVLEGYFHWVWEGYFYQVQKEFGVDGPFLFTPESYCAVFFRPPRFLMRNPLSFKFCCLPDKVLFLSAFNFFFLCFYLSV